MHTKDIRTGGVELERAQRALILLHGRGAPAEDILGLASHLSVNDFALLAPQAANYTWYPYSFLAPVEQNEPWLSSAIELLAKLVDDINKAGIPDDRIYFTGFSQGACVALEFPTRNARRWGGIAAFTGGLIGDSIDRDRYRGQFSQTPIFIGSSDPDMHVPVARVQESTALLTEMGANVREVIYPDIGHTIIQEELDEANRWVFNQ